MDFHEAIIPMTEILNQALKQIDSAHTEILDLWRSLVNRDCGSANREGVNAVSEDVAEFLRALGFRTALTPYEKAGNLLIADFGPGKEAPILLLGHLDTVFNKAGESAKRPFTVDGDRVTGPGVLDMKGGVTILLSALKSLIGCGWSRDVRVIFAGDEEVGHRFSDAARDMANAARGARLALNFETSYPDNSIVIRRSGVAVFEVTVKGVSTHVGNAPELGRSAVVELAHKIIAMETLTDRTKGTNVNVGVISGGTVPNACPEEAHATVDLRFQTQTELKRIREAMNTLQAKQYVPGTTTRITESVCVPAMEPVPGTEKLLAKVNEIARTWGFPELRGKGVGGGSDSAITTSIGIPTLCALGVKGELNHTSREYAILSSLWERTRFTCALLTTL